MAKRHARDTFLIPGEGVFAQDANGNPVLSKPTAVEEVRRFRFSRLHPVPGERPSKALLQKVAEAMTANDVSADSGIPAGFTYLGQFIDHDLTLDKTAKSLGEEVTVEELLQGRSPVLDLDSVYGLGPAREPEFYTDGQHLKIGVTAAATFPQNDAVVNQDLDGFDLPRVGSGSSKRERRQARIPDHRNDENLIVAQTHLAFIRFHNRVVDRLAEKGVTGNLFARARETVVKHYQWMVRHDFLPRLIDEGVLTDVFTNGRKFFEVTTPAGSPTADAFGPVAGGDDFASMPIEFSVAAYRLGHSMVRGAYQWNRVFQSDGPGPVASLELLFRFSGTSGNLSPSGALEDQNGGDFERLPTNWIADWRRLFDFRDAGRADLVPPAGRFNRTRRIDTRLVDPLKTLAFGSFGGAPGIPVIERNLAFRNLIRGWMVALPSGQQMASFFGEKALTADEIVNGNDGAKLQLSAQERTELVGNTPLWFYILREAEVRGEKGHLGKVGSRIIAETFHRAMETSGDSIVRDRAWRPDLGTKQGEFSMVDLLLFAFEGKVELLNPLGD